jgi:hypothetical protein
MNSDSDSDDKGLCCLHPEQELGFCEFPVSPKTFQVANCKVHTSLQHSFPTVTRPRYYGNQTMSFFECGNDGF